jgi:hypothetical protein
MGSPDAAFFHPPVVFLSAFLSSIPDFQKKRNDNLEGAGAPLAINAGLRLMSVRAQKLTAGMIDPLLLR